MPVEWLDDALAESDARSAGSAGTLQLYLKKTAQEVLVKGSAKVRVIMPCSRTLDPVTIELEAPIFLLLEPKSPSANARPRRRARSDGKAARPTREEGDEGVLTPEDAARDRYDGETVVLDEFVREHLLLELPLFPLRSDLPSDEPAATRSLPDSSGPAEREGIDPRLAPLAALRQAMKGAGAKEK